MKDLFENKTFLVTGGLGSIGSAIVEKLLKFNIKQIRIFDNRETELFYLREKYKNENRLRFLQGDVREKERLSRAMEGADIVFHAAALKHVLLCEYDPFEAVKTNVLGTQNVIECSLSHNIEKVILISTDKAVNPFNVMGTTKLLAERLISSMHHNRGASETKFGAVRFGNVLDSRGSVLEIWKKQIEENKKITITDPEMTRFFMSIPQSVDLILNATKLVEDSEIFIFKMNGVKIKDLAEAFLELNNKDKNDYEIIGKKLGEKMHEDLIFDVEQDFLMENEEIFVKLPLVQDKHQHSVLFEKYNEKGFRTSQKTKFRSNEEEFILDKNKIKKMIFSYFN